MAKRIFISYRRKDSMYAVHAISAQLGARFGPSQVFMDVRSIAPGEQWPQRIQTQLTSSTVVLAVIGPNWLMSQDPSGRRRLDLEDDWVRQELALAIKEKLPLIPLYLSGAPELSARDLPSPLQELAELEGFKLYEDAWRERLNDLAKYLITKYRFVETDTRRQAGEGIALLPELAGEELYNKLSQLNGWEYVEWALPNEYPDTRFEIRKLYTFGSFRDALRFMTEASVICEDFQPYPHHPRWENMEKNVTVWLSTWDIKHKITEMDIKMAIEFDKLKARLSAN
jgi:pterin-4a-carbinolamine dehydratase